MNIEKLLNWQKDNPKYRSFKISTDATCQSLKPKYLNRIFLYEYEQDNKKDRSILIPLELLDSIEDIDNFISIEELIKEHDSKLQGKVIPFFLYPKDKYGFNLKGHYMSLRVVMISEIMKFIEGEEFKEYYMDNMKEFFEDIHKTIGLDNFNENNMEYFDLFYDELDKFFNMLRNYIVDNYNFREINS